MENEILNFLFERKPEGFEPQIGYADGNKKVLAWVPGSDDAQVRTYPDAVYFGVTPGAFQDSTKSMRSQPCAVCWFGLDIDLDEPPTMEDIERLRSDLPAVSIRTSCGGNGLHLFWRLSAPVILPYHEARRLVRRLASAKALRCHLPVCSSDYRLFYVTGGANRWLHQSALFTDANEECANLPQPGVVVPDSVEPTPTVRLQQIHPLITWLNMHSPVKILESGSYKVHVGTIVGQLRIMGEMISTKSPGQNSWHCNGYLDVTPESISLFSYADGHVIWRWQDLDKWL